MLERVDGRVADGSLVQKREVPEIEIRRPDRQRHERVREHPQTLDGPEREQRPQHRPRKPGEQAERCEVADQDVLEHVEAEELLLADRSDGGGEREQKQRDPQPEEKDPVAGHGRPAAMQGASPHRVRDRCEQDGRELQRVESPVGQHVSTLGSTVVKMFHYHLVTSRVRQVEARYVGKLAFGLVARHGRIGEEYQSFEAGIPWRSSTRWASSSGSRSSSAEP